MWAWPILDLKMAETIVDSKISLDVRQALVGTGVGALTFPVVLGLNQVGLKSLRISSGSPFVIASAAGGLSVSLASLLASTAVLKSCTMSRSLLNSNGDDSNFLMDSRVDFTLKDLLVSAISGVVFFRALGGRFGSVLPSHLHHPGAFARQWIPAHFVKYANDKEKELIQAIGSKHGCHSCGTRIVKQFYADHQPPNAVVRAKLMGKNNGITLQRFYPHCQSCSKRQAVSLHPPDSKILPIVSHSWWSIRSHHIFLPTSILVLLLKATQSSHKALVVPSSEQTLPVSNREEQQQAAQVEVKEKKADIIREPAEVQRNLTGLVNNFPLLIVWQKLAVFIDSYSPVGSFHLTLWAFSIVAALGTI